MEFISQTEKEFDELYRANADDVYKVCLYYLYDEDKAVDITEKTFIRMYHSFDEVEPENRRKFLINTARRYAYQEKKRLEEEKANKERNESAGDFSEAPEF